MHCVVTAGPTYEPLDKVRRLTNFSTGRLGTELANFLSDAGHDVTLLIGEQATYRGPAGARHIQSFSTTADLREKLESLRATPVHALFHASAVSDFTFGKVWKRSATGEMSEVQSGKFSTRDEGLLVELRPATKIIASLRDWFPNAWLVGWKYEVDGDRDSVIAKAVQQIAENRMNGCVANGPSFGPGFGFVTGPDSCRQAVSDQELFNILLEGSVACAGE
jgi:phosphopantothenoylcysteine decarboxylase/phosphopantothenate--cysteine ligase